MPYLLVLFIAIPFIELTLLLSLAEHVGAPATLGLIVLTGILGASLARWQGWKTYERINTELQNQRMPGEALADAGMILVAGALLLTPGILTDVFGFSLLVPICRSFYRRLIMKSFRGKFKVHTSGFGTQTQAPSDPNVVDGHVVRPAGESSQSTPTKELP